MLDNGIIWSVIASKQRVRLVPVSQALQRRLWERARLRFRLAGDAVYDSDEADDWVEQQCLAEATRCWSAFARGVDRGRLNWSNQRVLRDLDMERELAALEMVLSVDRTRRSRRRTGGRRGRTVR